jgi:Mg-chelatase subunit ChlD
VLDPTVMTSILGASTPLAEGLEATAEWFRDESESS